MPEGDAIFRTARTLNRALAGRKVVRFESVFPALTRVHDEAPLTERTIESVTSAGKHVLMRFSALRQAQGAAALSERGGLMLRTHMRMNGSWHVYRPGERWRKPRRDMRIVIATDAYEAVGFNVPVAEFLDARAEARQDDLRKLGPDLLGETFDEDEALRRIREHDAEEIANVLLNQRVVAGIGNVYKSEVLFLCGIDPFATASAIGDQDLRRILATARKYLRANVNGRSSGIVTYMGFRRDATPGQGRRHYVYARARRPCRKCGTPIRVGGQGPHAKLTWWCPSCQR